MSNGRLFCILEEMRYICLKDFTFVVNKEKDRWSIMAFLRKR